MMKNALIILSGLCMLLTGSLACKTNSMTIPNTNMETNNSDTMSSQLKIRIGTKTFTATLLNNQATTAFKARLPMTVSMSELNGNEKLYRFPTNLPTSSSNPGTIHTGDLMLYGSNTLVLFYQSFPTPYSYTKLGRIDDPAGLAAAVGSGSVTVTFE
ncbi:cyclophilin-like fold protein [Dyadobacter sp. LHD-138]|uniref:cyclophilin-like fold protein n=1 Tax=Dyadobacter sp. LHD-138 TaxID=3071413 RepID=UPI0027DEB3AE|nr:cyclophilin-like fold protein [Dyadobacter sp. LHD-138]MDQ6476870.1 cyclophilin-like fold protein [Dyadobacter sp. LHD-138]